MADLGISIALNNISAYQAQLNRAANATDSSTKKMEGGTNRVRRSVDNLTAQVPGIGRAFDIVTNPIVAAGAAIAGVSAALVNSIQKAAEFEKTQVSFEVLIGDAQQAEATLDSLAQFAASTPFELPGINVAARQLLAFGTSAENVPDVLRRIGDIAAGIDAPLSELSEIYGKIQTQGRVFAEDINQLTGRGIPVISELAKQFDVAESEVRDLVSSGQVGFPQIEQAFVSLTEEGGRFFNLMERQSQTFSGLTSTLRDNISAVQREIGAALIPVVSELVRGLISATQSVGDFVRTSGVIQAIGNAFASLRAFASAAFSAISSALSPVIASLQNFGQQVFALFAAIRQALAPINDAISRAFGSASSSLLDAFGQALALTIDALAAVVAALAEVTSFLSENTEFVVIAAGAWLAYQVATGGIGAILGRVVAALLSTRAATVATTVATQAATVATRVWAVLSGGLPAILGAARAAMFALNVVIAANPIGLLITGIAAVIAGFAAWYNSSQRLRAGIAGVFSAIERIIDNFIGGFILQAQGIALVLDGLFTLDLQKIKAGFVAVSAGVRAVTLDIGRGAGQAFADGYDEKVASEVEESTRSAGEAARRASEQAAQSSTRPWELVGDSIQDYAGKAEDTFGVVVANARQAAGETSTALDTINDKVSAPGKAAAAAAGSFDALTAKVRELQSQMDSISPNSEKFAELRAQIQETERELARVRIQQIEVRTRVNAVDLSRIDAAVEQVESDFANASANVSVGADVSPAQAAVSRLQQELATVEGVLVPVRFDIEREALDSIRSLEGEFDALSTVRLELERGDLEAARDAIASLSDVAPVEIRADLAEIEAAIARGVELDATLASVQAAQIQVEQGELDSALETVQQLQAQAGSGASLSIVADLSQVASAREAISELSSTVADVEAVRVLIEQGDIESASAAISDLKGEIEAATTLAIEADATGIVDASAQIEALRVAASSIEQIGIAVDAGEISEAISEVGNLKLQLADFTVIEIEADAQSLSDAIAQVEALGVSAAQIDAIRLSVERGELDQASQAISDIFAQAQAVAAIEIDADASQVRAAIQEIDRLGIEGEQVDAIRIAVETGQVAEAAELIRETFAELRPEIEIDGITQAADQVRALQNQAQGLGALRIEVEELGISAIDSRIDSLRENLSGLNAQIAQRPGETTLTLLQEQAEATARQIRTLADLRIEITGTNIPALTDQLKAYEAALKTLEPGPAFDRISDKIRELDVEINRARVIRIDAQTETIDGLNEKLKALDEIANTIGPDDPQFADVIREIQEVEARILQLNNQRILIEAGINIDLDNIVIPAIEVPIRAKIDIESNIPTAIEPINELKAAADAIGVSFGFANNRFRDAAGLMDAATSSAAGLATGLGATQEQAIDFALDVEAMGQEVERVIVSGVANSFQAFGNEIGKALASGASAADAFATLFRGLLSVILVEVPKLVGMFLLQSAVGLGFPAGVPFAVAGLALLALSGIAGGLLSSAGNGQQQVAQPQATQSAALGAQATGSGSGLSAFNADSQAEQTRVTNLTVLLESDGIVDEIERRQIVERENQFGG
jgi:tape measure domain-containing protein